MEAPPAFPKGALPGDFVAQGKLSLRPIGPAASPTEGSAAAASGKRPVKGFSASFRWQQRGEEYDLELWGALGQGRTRITGTADSIKIVDGTGRVVKSRRPQRLLARHLGWSLPLAVLPYWLQGKAAPAPPARLMRFQPNSDLDTLEQLDWALEFARYSAVTGLTRQSRLPGRIKASNAELKLTIVAREWEDIAAR